MDIGTGSRGCFGRGDLGLIPALRLLRLLTQE